MTTAITATYAIGVFKPHGEVDLDEGARVWLMYEATGGIANAEHSETDAFSREEALLDEDERLFDGAFGDVGWDDMGWDEARVNRGSRLIWDAAWMSAKRVAAERGWECETREQASLLMMRLGGVNEKDATGGDIGLFQ